MITNAQMHQSQRLAGMVKRYHEHPTTREQTVAEHSWHVARIWLSIFMRGSRDYAECGKVLVYILRHDVGEFGVGDVPFPMKKDNPVLKAEMDRLEEVSLARQGLDMPQISIWEKKFVKIADLIEMAEFGLHETRLGNQYGEMITTDTLAVVRGMLNDPILTLANKQSIKIYVRDNLGVQL